tara:strand:+ start:441 stop:1250 length:810 start_codon:yes stop_codon:yes gene_type:complete
MLNYNYDNSDNLIEDESSNEPILENNEETNDNENYNNYNLLENFYNNNFIDFEVQVLDISNLRNTRDASRSAILEQLYNIEHNSSNLNSNFLINFIENNMNRILQNSIEEPNDSPFIENFINSTFELDNKKKFKRVTHDNELRKLKIQKFDNSNIYANNECPINLTKFEKNDEIIILPCKHVYTALPIQKWLNEESNCCPICRFELMYKEIKCEENNDDENEGLEEENNFIEEINPVNNYYNDDNDYYDDNDITLQQILLNSYSSNNST